jgi:hypothetical protein
VGSVISRHTRPLRLVVTVAVAVLLLYVCLARLEHGGPSPVRPFGQNIASLEPTAESGTTSTTDNPNAGCKPKPPHDCRPPSGS